MFGHKHEWYRIDDEYQEETKPYGNHGFVKTIYYYFEQCAKCGEQSRVIYSDFVHKPKNDTAICGETGREKIEAKE